MTEKFAISVEEAAERLSVSKNYAYDRVKDGTLPSVKVGNRVLVPVKALEEWIEANTKGGETSTDSPSEGVKDARGEKSGS